ncbi:MAG: hypothetical protein F6K24_52970 [Okeania sp. SIO2D1]|nr:hypothetical protein [Okeania sp. SIO2D1]
MSNFTLNGIAKDALASVRGKPIQVTFDPNICSTITENIIMCVNTG